MTDVSPLFRPFTLRGMELKNRIAMAPMTPGQSPGGFPHRRKRRLLRAPRGERGRPHPLGRHAYRRKGASNDANIPLFWGEEALAGWKKVIDAVHKSPAARWARRSGTRA
jgi:2,4-dienoyl-CoA reductase-like NADH-dependent reductase (Old Yellow Enzyme family)